MNKIIVNTGKWNNKKIDAIASKYINDGFFVLIPSQESTPDGVLSAVRGHEKCAVLLSVDDSIDINNNNRITDILNANSFSMEHPK